MTRNERPICITVILAVIVTLLTALHLHAQTPLADDQPFTLFLPQISFAADPTLSAYDLDMLFAPEEDVELPDAPLVAAAAPVEINSISYRTLRSSDGGQPTSALATRELPNTNSSAD